MSTPDDQITDDQWATAPLLDQGNVGKYVRVGGDPPTQRRGRTAVNVQIVKITRTNIHLERYGRPLSLRVDGYGATATQAGDFPEHACTMQYELDVTERYEKLAAIHRALQYRGGDKLSIAQIRAVHEIVTAP